ncbi:hypothetical protein AOC36_08525 [Erysipelothrix larvae]|uniref:Uncharacterized protein n=1 Tax=Erysipelothrix larvae TaxID=1514105 RepID=A0A0X8H0U9_9FIRM|nr:hypothetical protein [Erysipelothrix larvae]AMC94029.1 hypothetical protein AOC36_08525 [Erysipelothrix larvae]
MIRINEDEKVIISYDSKDYCLKDKEQYKQFVIKLTDPITDFHKDNLEIDESVQDPRLKSICEKYKQFFSAYLDDKNNIIQKAKSEFSKFKEENEQTK